MELTAQHLMLIETLFPDVIGVQFKSAINRYDKKEGRWKWDAKIPYKGKRQPCLLSLKTLVGMCSDRMSFARCPVWTTSKGKQVTQLAWFDIDKRSVSQNTVAAFAAIIQALDAKGANYIAATSGGEGRYHIYLVFDQPQCVKYLQRAMEQFLAGIPECQGLQVEVGPKRGKKIRPFMLSKNGRPGGNLIWFTGTNDDAKCLGYVYEEKKKPVVRMVSRGFQFNLESYIPLGPAERNSSNRRMVKDLLDASWPTEEVVAASRQLHAILTERGLARDSEEQQVTETLHWIRTYKPPVGDGSYQKVLDAIKQRDKVSLRKVAATLQHWADTSGKRGFVLTARTVAEIYKCGVMTANRMLKALQEMGVLKVLHQGGAHKGDASIYSYIRKTIITSKIKIGTIVSAFTGDNNVDDGGEYGETGAPDSIRPRPPQYGVGFGGAGRNWA